jgi:hypothetical protein
VKIIAFIFIVLAGFLNLQPLISSRPMVSSTMKCCSKTMRCQKKEQQPRTPCANNACNPFMACAYGNFYLLAKNGFEFNYILMRSDRPATINDNRLSDNASDCWHPPRMEAPFQLTII